jgi:hypothetical protein
MEIVDESGTDWYDKEDKVKGNFPFINSIQFFSLISVLI